jgi:type II secretory pathway pseudopilin PulG
VSGGRRRGGVLLEIVVALSIFIGAGSFALSALNNVLDAVDRSGREQVAIDLARSKMAELEAGLITLEDLRDEMLTTVGSVEVEDGLLGTSLHGWEIDVQTQRTAFPGLTLVELTVSERTATGDASDDPAKVRFSLRQLVELGEAPAEGFEEDDLLRGLENAP